MEKMTREEIIEFLKRPEVKEFLNDENEVEINVVVFGCGSPKELYAKVDILGDETDEVDEDGDPIYEDDYTLINKFCGRV